MKLIKFSARWCNPCKAQLPTYLEIKKEFPTVVFQEVDCEEQLDLVAKYSVTGVPFYLLTGDDGEMLTSCTNVASLREMLADELPWNA